jgi:hypothetical protein
MSDLSDDREQLHKRALSTEAALAQLQRIKEGPQPQKLSRTCIPGDGIHVFSQSQLNELSREFEEQIADGRAMKFVTASGAATRMFRIQSSFLENGPTDRTGLCDAVDAGDSDAREVLRFIESLRLFPFWEQLERKMSSRGTSLEESLETGEYSGLLQDLLGKEGLKFSTLPKGLIPFHSYPEGPRTAVEEHLIEGLGYLKDRSGKVRVHFTVSPHHSSLVESHIERARKRFEGALQAQFEVGLSTQDPSTDTLVLDEQGQPLRDNEGSLVFRPGGHGALLESLDALGGDIVFIKTIDNVLPERFSRTICTYKASLGGILFRLQKQIFGFLGKLSTGDFNPKLTGSIEEFLKTMFFMELPRESSDTEKANACRTLLNRPLRVCGVIKHQGEPGGKPCWVSDPEGGARLQLVESAEVDLDQPDQRLIWEACQYFNPVDIVCGLKDFRGRHFRLSQYRDPAAAIVTTKCQDGRLLRVLEHPGLWNGSMAFWNTVFVEVPRVTCHPVKTVMDLLADAHQVEVRHHKFTESQKDL